MNLDIEVSDHNYLIAEKLYSGCLWPATKFMDEENYKNVSQKAKLTNGAVFPVPLSLPVSKEEFFKAQTGSEVSLSLGGHKFAKLVVESKFEVKLNSAAKNIFGTSSARHPGVRLFLASSEFYIGGAILDFENRPPWDQFDQFSIVRNKFEKSRGTNSLRVGFASRNILHRGHQYIIDKWLNRGAAVLVLTTIGPRKPGDYSLEAIKQSFDYFSKGKYASKNVDFEFVTMPPLLAGPREALLQAVIRRNHGCNYFIVGRDHSGVGDFYSRYEAQRYVMGLEDEIGVKVICESGPFYCLSCEGVVDSENCEHVAIPGSNIEISASDIRAKQSTGVNDDRFFDQDLWDRLRFDVGNFLI